MTCPGSPSRTGGKLEPGARSLLATSLLLRYAWVPESGRWGFKSCLYSLRAA